MSFFASSNRRADLAEEARRELLRAAYRLDRPAHGELVEAAALAAERLGIDDPVTLYQAQDGSTEAANALVVSLPGRRTSCFSGRLLELVEGAELVAVVGHELAPTSCGRSTTATSGYSTCSSHGAASDVAAQPCHAKAGTGIWTHA